MEGILFLVFWLGGAALHTLFDLKIKPVVQAVREEGIIPTGSFVRLNRF